MPRALGKSSDDTAGMLRRLRAMLRYLPALERGDSPGQWYPMERQPDGTLVYRGFQSSDLTLGLLKAAYRHGWVLHDDWRPWTEMVREWECDLGLINSASVEEIARALTVYLRADRFSEGTWARAIEDGIVLAMVRRMRGLAEGIARGPA